MSNPKYKNIIIFNPPKKNNNNLKFETKVISITTSCEICKKEIIINNSINNYHFCKECENVDIDVISNEVTEELDEILMDDWILSDDFEINFEHEKNEDE